jgi:hypothetical protein
VIRPILHHAVDLLAGHSSHKYANHNSYHCRPRHCFRVQCTSADCRGHSTRGGRTGGELLSHGAVHGHVDPGRSMVSDDAWEKFLAEVVTPLFPDGFTILGGRGQYREASERSRRSRATFLFFLYKKADRKAPALRSNRSELSTRNALLKSRSCVSTSRSRSA